MGSTERSVSLWEATTTPPAFPPLTGDLTVDVCVIGGGIAGVTTAYLLAREGVRVALIERERIGAGETGQTTAHLSSEQDDYFDVIQRMHGRDGARIAYESHQTAIETIARIVADENIDCDFRRTDGYLIAATGKDRKFLRKRTRQRKPASRASNGLTACRSTSGTRARASASPTRRSSIRSATSTHSRTPLPARGR